jgi:hypothetical protein
MRDEDKVADGKPPALDFLRATGIKRSDIAKDAAWLINSVNDSIIRHLTEVCSEYSDTDKHVVAQSIRFALSVSDHDDDDFGDFFTYLVEAAPALAPFFNDPKHRFHTQQHKDAQIGEWAMNSYYGFCKTPYTFRRDYIRGYALIFFITGPSAPRNAACGNAELLAWIGAHAVELGAHFPFLEEHKTWDRDFLEQLLDNSSKPLAAGIL